MSKIEVNTIETTSGSTLTIGKSGDTVTLTLAQVNQVLNLLNGNQL